MAFSDFKAIPEVQEKFGIRHVENDFIESKNSAGPSEQFLQEFDLTAIILMFSPPRGHDAKPLSIFGVKTSML